MNSKSFVKKVVKRTPLRTSFMQNSQTFASTSNSTSIYSAISSKPIAVEDYNRVLMKNQRLAKENAVLRNQMSCCKESLNKSCNENIELKQQVIKSKTEIQRLRRELKDKSSANMTQVCDRIKYANSLLMDEYFRVNAMKEQMNEFGNKIETMRGIMSSLESMVDTRSDGNGADSEMSGERVDPFWTLNDSSVRRDSRRFSLSAQEQDIRRRLSADKIKHDFQVMTELSTILELSRENRISSIGFVGDFTSGDDNPFVINELTATTTSTSTFTSSSSATTIQSLGSIMNDETNDNLMTRTREEEGIKAKKTPKSKPITTKKKTQKKNENGIQKKYISLYDLNDGENKGDVIPFIVRKSKRIESKKLLV